MQLNKFILIVVVLAAASCVDRFIPQTTGYDKMLFIECLISNDTARIPVLHASLSAPVTTEDGGKLTFKPAGLSGVQALIDCSDGSRYSFAETVKGTYMPVNSFKPETGKSYQLVIHYDGNTYESDIQTLRVSPPIDSISHKHVLQKRSEDGVIVDGYRFYASTHETNEGPSFYRWDMDATFRYEVPYNATHIWDGRKTNPASNKLIRTCWKSKTIAGIYIAKTEGLTENRITEAPLSFESQYGDELTIRYSLKVRQYTLSESAMTTWENFQKLISETGSLYQSQPFRVDGNIKCTSDPSVYVAGIFEVAGVSSARIFVDKPAEFTVVPVECILMVVGGRDFPWYRLPAGSYVTEEKPNQFMTASPSCYDCRLREGTLDKPPFWIDQ